MSDSFYEELAEKVKEFQNGDESAYDDLYRNGQKFVQAEVAKYLKSQDDIQEVTQKVFISVYRSLNTLKNPLTFVDWMRTIARNESLAFLKSSYKKHNVEWSSLSQSDEDGNESDYDPADENLSYQPQAVMDADSKREILKGFLDTLPDNQRLCVSMYFFDDLSIKEIAEDLSFPENTVKSNLRYAKIKLKDQIEDYSKKHDIKLYSISPFALLLYLFKSQEADLIHGYANTISSNAVQNAASSGSKNASKTAKNDSSAPESAKGNAGKTSSAENQPGTGKTDTGIESGSSDVNTGGSSASASAESAAGHGNAGPGNSGAGNAGTGTGASGTAGTATAGTAAAGTAAAGAAAAAGGSVIAKIAIIGAVAAAAAGGAVIANQPRNAAGSSSSAESTETPISSESPAAETPEKLYTFTYDSSIAAGSDIDPTQSVAGKVILRVDSYDADSGELLSTDYYHYNSMGLPSIKYYDSQSLDGYDTYQYTRDGRLTKEWTRWGDPVEPEYFFEVGAYSIHVDPHMSTNPYEEVPMATAVNNETGEVIEPDPSTYQIYYGEDSGKETNQVYDENGFLISSERSDYGSVIKTTFEYYSDGSLYRVISQIGASTLIDVYQYASPEEANALFNDSVPEEVKALTETYDPPIEPTLPMGVIRINADNLNIRTYPTTSSPNITQNVPEIEVASHAMTGEVFPVYGIVEADGYTWYEIAESIFPETELERQAWVANQDNWVTYYSALDN